MGLPGNPKSLLELNSNSNNNISTYQSLNYLNLIKTLILVIYKFIDKNMVKLKAELINIGIMLFI